jgi:hypothetical protein
VQCPRRWEELTPSDEPTVKHCSACDQLVFFCVTDEETIAHAKAGHCIARELPDESELPHTYLGQPQEVPPVTEQQDRAERLMLRERGIDDSIKNAQSSSRCCPRCQYPAPNWRKTCRICGFEMGRVLNRDL